MEWASEERWCAGWLIDLETALKGDLAYDWLVEQAGGYFSWPDNAARDTSPQELIEGRPLKFIKGKP